MLLQVLDSDHHEQANLLHEGLFALGGAGERVSVVDCQSVWDRGRTVLLVTTTVGIVQLLVHVL